MAGDQVTGDGGERPAITLVGERVCLGPLHRGLLPLMWKWESDLALSVLTGDPTRPLTPEAIEADYERATKSGPERASFAIYARATLRPIGTAGLRDVNYAHGTAELGMGIGEADCWGKGYGTEATRLLLDYAFDALGLRNVLLTTFSYNERAIRAYRRAGFKEIGRRRQAHRIGQQSYDEVFMDCLWTDPREPLLPKLIP